MTLTIESLEYSISLIKEKYPNCKNYTIGVVFRDIKRDLMHHVSIEKIGIIVKDIGDKPHIIFECGEIQELFDYINTLPDTSQVK